MRLGNRRFIFPFFILAVFVGLSLVALLVKDNLNLVSADPITSIEKVFKHYKGTNDKITRVDDSSVWWVAPDGLSIINDNSKGVKLAITCGEFPDESGYEQFLKQLEKMDPEINSVMTKLGYTFNEPTTSSRSHEEGWLRHVQAYEKGQSKCALEAYDCSSTSEEEEVMKRDITFSCTDDFEKNYMDQAKYLKDLGLKDFVVRVAGRSGDFVALDLTYKGFGGHYVVAKLVNGKWIELVAGQDYPDCNTVKKYQIPGEILDKCYDSATDTSVTNSL